MPKAPSKPAAKKPAAKKPAARPASKPAPKATKASAPKAGVKKKKPMDKLAYGVAKKGPGPVPPLPVKDGLLAKAGKLKDQVIAALKPGKSKAKK